MPVLRRVHEVFNMCVVSDLALVRAYWNLRTSSENLDHFDYHDLDYHDLDYHDLDYHDLEHLDAALSRTCPWICVDHVSHELNTFLRGQLLPSIRKGTDDFELKYLNNDKELGMCLRLWTYIEGVISSKSWQDGLLQMFPQGSVEDGSMKTLFDRVFYWGIYATLSGSFSTGMATKKTVTLASQILKIKSVNLPPAWLCSVCHSANIVNNSLLLCLSAFLLVCQTLV